MSYTDRGQEIWRGIRGECLSSLPSFSYLEALIVRNGGDIHSQLYPWFHLNPHNCSLFSCISHWSLYSCLLVYIYYPLDLRLKTREDEWTNLVQESMSDKNRKEERITCILHVLYTKTAFTFRFCVIVAAKLTLLLLSVSRSCSSCIFLSWVTVLSFRVFLYSSSCLLFCFLSGSLCTRLSSSNICIYSLLSRKIASSATFE